MTEDNFKHLIKERGSARPDEGFDNDMMLLIKKHAANKSKEKKYLTLMYFFFVTGLLLGFTIAITYVDPELVIGNGIMKINKTLLYFPLTFMVLFLFEKIYKATLVSIGKERFSSM